MTVRLNVVGIVVQDMGRSLAFYRRLGLDVPAGADGEPHVEAVLAGGMKLTWDTEATIRSFMPGFQRHGHGNDGMSLAFELDSPAEVDTLYQELVDLGHHGEMKPWDAFWGQRYAVLHDPDGNGVDLYCAL
ncbi:putative glyoxalase superfamily protein PhnB [Kibdelosporangium banguiense]|uniref:Glyoxalase superfamily protein PhnB n=1 Tax=Kibdelosporangium banguiense TaxID=1365924 RepID=A0ABS4TU76_9PSEU|nr:VOC family protein [Kibdelosporangium banguiense]MBP2327518.1 putative glyoxalase superfamily protein PhnB [Kibdelosporangium banguiense]